MVHNTTLESLDVSDNKISDTGVSALIEFCTKNPNLKEIIIDGCTDVTEGF
jgi:Leucine-rich repeat (LRR) protein